MIATILYVVLAQWVLIIIMTVNQLQISRKLDALSTPSPLPDKKQIEEDLDTKLENYQSLAYGHPLNTPMTDGRRRLEKKINEKKQRKES